MKVVAVVPAHDEARGIEAVVRGALAHLSQVVVVDDGSTDATAALAEAAGARVVRLGRNEGKGTAVRAGLSYVLATDAKPVLVDSEPDTFNIDTAMVVGERVFVRSAMPASRYWANVIGSWALATLMGVDLRDTQSWFRLVRTDVLRTLDLEARGYEFETELVVQLARRGARIARVPIAAVYAGETSKLRPVRDTTRNVVLALVYRFARRDRGGRA